jgi:hypothetical protein
MPSGAAGILEICGNCGNCAFPGNSRYPLADSVQAKGNCSSDGANPAGIDAFVLGDPQTHNRPNINDLNSLFNAPPQGLGVDPSDPSTVLGPVEAALKRLRAIERQAS